MTETKALVKSDPFYLMDRLDDKAIVAELEGRLPDVLTYHFNDGKQEIWGLSKPGVDECKTELAKKGEVLRELEMHWDDKEKEAFFTVKAARYAVSGEKEVLLDTAIGVKRQAKFYAGSGYNTFWFEQGAMKACRNACYRLIPETIKQAVIEYAKKQGRVHEVKSEDVPKAETESQPQTKEDRPSDNERQHFQPSESSPAASSVKLKNLASKIKRATKAGSTPGQIKSMLIPDSMTEAQVKEMEAWLDLMEDSNLTIEEVTERIAEVCEKGE